MAGNELPKKREDWADKQPVVNGSEADLDEVIDQVAKTLGVERG
ncbi:hypothetical protein GCM10010402_69310 [Actinomadura luteofluorescens]|nr:hypothetical protein [Actinomadura glauciflava]MCR3741945.1 hypothetical protein [Actinomadura glauciflava]